MMLNINKEHRSIECCNCAVIFTVSVEFDNNLRESKKTFYCPNGHPQSYTKSTSERLKKELEEKREIIESKDREIRILSAKLKENPKPKRQYTKRKKA